MISKYCIALLLSALGFVLCHASHAALPTSCGPLHAYVKQRLTMYDQCQTITCCCEYMQRRPLLTVISIISGPNQCSSRVNQLLLKVNEKCVNQSITFSDCPQENGRYFIIRRTHISNPMEDSVRPEKTRTMREEIGWHRLSLIMIGTVVASLIVIIYLAKTLIKSEVKQPLNSIHDPKKKSVPNLYSSV